MTAAVEAVDSAVATDWEEDRAGGNLTLVKAALEADDFFDDPAGADPDIMAAPKATALVQTTIARTLATVGFASFKSNWTFSDLPNSQLDRGIMIHTRPFGQSNCLFGFCESVCWGRSTPEACAPRLAAAGVNPV